MSNFMTLLTALLGSAGFALLFNVRKQLLPLAALGGALAGLWKRAAVRSPFRHPVDTGVEALAEAVSTHPGVRVHRSAGVVRVAVAPGRFTVVLAEGNGARVAGQVGAIVLASGFRPYDARRLPELGYGETDIVRLRADKAI